MVRASDSGMLLTEDPGSIPRSCRLPNKLSLQWKGRPVVKSTATSDLRLVRGGLRHPVSQVADENPLSSSVNSSVVVKSLYREESLP